MSNMSHSSSIRSLTDAPAARRGFTAQIIPAVAAVSLFAIVLTACARRPGGEVQESSPPAEGPARISGTVTASDTGEPIPYVQVGFFDLSGAQVGGPGNSDLSGAYHVELPAGRYYGVANIINPSHPLGWNGFSPTWTGGRPVKSPSGVIEVSPGEQKRIDFALLRLRPATGHVSIAGSATVPSGSWVSVLDAASGEHFTDVSIESSGRYETQLPDGEWSFRFSVPGFVQRTSLKVSVSGAPVEIPSQHLEPQS
jgi:hypothetical protein